MAKKYFNSEEVKIFGSRTDLNRRGGDIDIYIRTDNEDKILLAKIAFLREFEKQCGDQKVDLIIEQGINSKNKIFEIARNEGIRI